MPIGGTAFFGMNQHPRITTLYLNALSRRGDPGPGLNVGGRQDYVNGGQVGFSGQIAQPYSGFIGGKLTITDPWAKQFSDPLVGPLYGGIYMYVQLAMDSEAPIRGQILFWEDELNYTVTTDGDNPPSKIAGVAVNPTDPGNWDFIQIAGIARVYMTAGGDLGALVGVVPSDETFGVIVTTITQNFLGKTVLTAPVANALNPVQLNLLMGYNF